MKILNIVETAYRATLEEQDDTVLWLSHALKGAGADIDILLQGNAVNYAVVGQDPNGLRIGAYKQSQPPDIPGDLVKFVEKGSKAYIVLEDLEKRGIRSGSIIHGLDPVQRSDLSSYLHEYDQVWYW